MNNVIKVSDYFWILEENLQGTQDLLSGKLSEQEPPWPMPCRKYVCGRAGFLY